jgi:hypothetical protein
MSRARGGWSGSEITQVFDMTDTAVYTARKKLVEEKLDAVLN